MIRQESGRHRIQLPGPGSLHDSAVTDDTVVVDVGAAQNGDTGTAPDIVSGLAVIPDGDVLHVRDRAVDVEEAMAADGEFPAIDADG